MSSTRKLQANGSLGQAAIGEYRRWLAAALPQPESEDR